MPSYFGNIANESCGWASDLPFFKTANLDEIVAVLTSFVRDASPEQIRAWEASLSPLQEQCSRVIEEQPNALRYCAVLEYRMPEGTKRVDAVLLLAGAVLVVEMKGDGVWQPDYREQAADYARRLSWYHRECWGRKVEVRTLLVNYGQDAPDDDRDFITTTHISRLAPTLRRFDRPHEAEPLPLDRFIAPGVCQPSPSLVQAARSYFARHELPRIKRIDEITGRTLARATEEIRAAHQNRSRTLLLISGVPGAGKTYVGLQIAHDSTLDDLAEPMSSGDKPTAPAVFLSGNGPLVAVLQYELRSAGGEGRVFVQGVKDFVQRYSKKRSGPPPHHVLIFDEAQRAWDEQRMKEKHEDSAGESEPAAFVAFAERVPGWSAVIGLIGNGQEIHAGEEGGIELWAEAIAKRDTKWAVIGPAQFKSVFADRNISYQVADDLHLSRSVRFHFAAGLSEWVAAAVEDAPNQDGLAAIARQLRAQGYQLRVTRDLRVAQEFLWKKYAELPDARYGVLTSSRDKGIGDVIELPKPAKFFRAGPWYADPPASHSSCCRLQEAITEFAAQGLELDHALVIWGTDFLLKDGAWNIAGAKTYRKGTVQDPLQLRRNAYRVLLTRGREGMIICLPKFRKELDETFACLVAAGCEELAT
ncbi:MAG: DNA/RNA helicase domain-containing protein [Opitutus sp.]